MLTGLAIFLWPWISLGKAFRLLKALNQPSIASHQLFHKRRTKVPLCSSGLRPLWGHCPVSPHRNSQSKQGNGSHWPHIALGRPVILYGYTCGWSSVDIRPKWPNMAQKVCLFICESLVCRHGGLVRWWFFSPALWTIHRTNAYLASLPIPWSGWADVARYQVIFGFSRRKWHGRNILSILHLRFIVDQSMNNVFRYRQTDQLITLELRAYDKTQCHWVTSLQSKLSSSRFN